MQMSFQGKVGSITVNGKVYELDKMHWHMPSEHTINGQRYPLEVHLVHKSGAGDLAVIGILYQYGAPDSFYFQVVQLSSWSRRSSRRRRPLVLIN
jgi:carbonic anhydrase